MNAAAQAVGLNTPIADNNAIRAGNFFNGRLLTSKDLGREQDNRRRADSWLGQAMGAGIAWGLEVSPQGAAAARTVQVKAGLAVNRAGQTLRLAADQVVTLVSQPDVASPGASTGFGPCGVLSGSTSYVAGNYGLYLLTLAPLMVDEGTAPVLALDPGNVRCNTDAKVEAVQLRLLYIDDALLPARGLDTNVVAPAAVSRLRNAAAYACFGFPALADAHGHPGTVPADNLLDALAKRDLSPCDVPLALIHLTASGIVFVDRWSVRRRIAADSAAPPWSALMGEKMDALGEAQLMQFQEQLAEVSDAAVGALTAATSFVWLPPAGFLDATGARQLDWRTFLGPHQPVREVPLAAGDVRAVLGAALRRDPVPVSAATRYRVYRITGCAQWMFVREAPNSPHAEEVWFDGTRAALDAASNVQQAIEMLRARSCAQVALWPTADVHAIVAALPGNTDVSLCFEAGDYKLSQPLVLAGLRHVTIHGAGAGSRLRIDSGECALRVNGCKSVTVSNLSLHADRMSSGKDEAGIGVRGALTVFSTPSVRIEGVSASCGGSGRIAGAGIVVSNPADARAKAGERSNVQISSCELLIGRAQVGIQCINTDLVVIRQNLISCSGNSDESLQRGIVVAGVTASEVRIEDNVVSGATEGINVGLSKSEAARGDALLAERVIVARNSVTLRVTDGEARNRHGIFIGNANSVLVQANRVVTENRKVPQVEVDGVTLIGVYGRQVIVRDNHFEGPRTGIVFMPGEDERHKRPSLKLERPDRVWLFAFNLAESATEALKCSPALIEAGVVVAEHNIAP